MATAPFRAPITKGINMPSISTKRTLSPADLQELARRIKALRTLSEVTNHSFARTLGSMVDALSLEQQIALGELLMDPTNNKPEAK